MRVERLEYGLRFIGIVEIENDNAKMIIQCAGQCARSLARPVLVQPGRKLTAKIGIGFGHPCVRHRGAIVGGSVHHVAKCGPVFVGRPDLVAFLFVGIGGVAGQKSDLPGRDIDGFRGVIVPGDDRAQAVKGVFRRLQDKLQGSQPLLAVDHFPARKTEYRVGGLIEHDRSEEMRGHRLAARNKNAVGSGANVVPQRFPLIFPLPDVWALKQRHRVPRLLGENVHHGNIARLHCFPLAINGTASFGYWPYPEAVNQDLTVEIFRRYRRLFRDLGLIRWQLFLVNCKELQMLIGYARVSTTDQVAGLEAQHRDLRATGCTEKIFAERVSSVAQRNELAAALDYVRDGDTLVVTRLDRLARSTADLLEIIATLERKGVALRILDFGGQAVDTQSPSGRLIVTMFGAVAQFERELLLQRQREGIAKAKAEGRYKGRAPTARRQAPQVHELREAGFGASDIAARLGMSRSSVYRILTDAAA